MNVLSSSSPNKFLKPKYPKTIAIAEHSLEKGVVIVVTLALIIVNNDTKDAIIIGNLVIVIVDIMLVSGFLFCLFKIKTINEYTKIPIAGANISLKTLNILLNTLDNPQ